MFEFINTARTQAPQSVETWLEGLHRPVELYFPCQPERRGRSAPRGVTTLLHGNEDSGLRAIVALWQQGVRPAHDIHVWIVSVEAAQGPPLFAYRHLPEDRDQNRCFADNGSDRGARRARCLLRRIDNLSLAALVDIHNTSGAGPAYGVATQDRSEQRQLVGLFSSLMVETCFHLGAIFEVLSPKIPCVTIECGGAGRERAHSVALAGLTEFFVREDLFEGDRQVEVVGNPLRLEIDADISLRFSSPPDRSANLCIRPDIERFNDEALLSGTLLGWTTLSRLPFCLRSADGTEHELPLALLENGEIIVTRTLRVMMATPRADIAQSDCLFYVLDA